MLYSDEERRIMADAIQPNMRKNNISTTPFEKIIEDYLSDFSFEGASVLDIGPGQLDFLDIAKKNGAVRTVGLDFDPAIQSLGSYRGHEVHLVDLRQGWPLKAEAFDLIFCRGSVNCHWYRTADRLREFLDDISGGLAADGNLWVVPWNKPAPGREEFTGVVESVISDWAERNRITIEVPDPSLHARYGIGYQIPEVAIWRR